MALYSRVIYCLSQPELKTTHQPMKKFTVALEF